MARTAKTSSRHSVSSPATVVRSHRETRADEPRARKLALRDVGNAERIASLLADAAQRVAGLLPLEDGNALRGRADAERLRKIAERILDCAHAPTYVLQIQNNGESARWSHRGCKSRICPICNPRGGWRRATRFEPQLAALEAAGCSTWLVTLTRAVQHGQQLARAMADVMDALQAIRMSQATRDAWRGLAGGVVGREATLRRPSKRARKRRGPMYLGTGRRAHAHLHVIVSLPPGVDVDPDGTPGKPWPRALAWLRDAWMHHCAGRGWDTAHAAQDARRVTPGQSDALRYALKYCTKPDDLQTAQDVIDVVEGTKGLRSHSSFGALQGAYRRNVLEPDRVRRKAPPPFAAACAAAVADVVAQQKLDRDAWGTARSTDADASQKTRESEYFWTEGYALPSGLQQLAAIEPAWLRGMLSSMYRDRPGLAVTYADRKASALMACDARKIPELAAAVAYADACLLYTSPSPRDRTRSRMPSSA